MFVLLHLKNHKNITEIVFVYFKCCIFVTKKYLVLICNNDIVMYYFICILFL